jgi:hypothetical protein
MHAYKTIATFCTFDIARKALPSCIQQGFAVIQGGATYHYFALPEGVY